MRKVKQSNAGTASCLLLAMVAVYTGCASSGPNQDQRELVLPMAPQSNERNQCGPSTLASVLTFHGAEVTEETISKAIYSPTARGILLQDMAWYARTQGFQAELRTGTLDHLKLAVEERQPPVVLLDLGIASYRKPHFTAVTGVTDGGVFQLGDQRADDFVRMDLFTRQWKRAGNQYLVITPAASLSH